MLHELIKFEGGVWVTSGRLHDFEGEPPVLAVHKGKWIDRIIEDEPTYDPAKARLESTVTISEDSVTVSYTVKKKTLVQVTEEKRAYISGELKDRMVIAPPGFAMLSEQARLLKRNTNATARMLKKRATKSGLTTAQMRDKIITESNVYEDSAGTVLGESDKLNSDIDVILAGSATNTQKINAVVAVTWP